MEESAFHDVKRATTFVNQLLSIPAGVNHRSTIWTLISQPLSVNVDKPVAINATFVTASGAIKGRLLGRLSLRSGSRGRHFLTFALNRDNHSHVSPSADWSVPLC